MVIVGARQVPELVMIMNGIVVNLFFQWVDHKKLSLKLLNSMGLVQLN